VDLSYNPPADLLERSMPIMADWGKIIMTWPEGRMA